MSPILARNRDRYPDDWREIREQVRDRSHDLCECLGECGVDHRGRCCALNGEEGIVLTVAHLDHTPETRDLNQLRHFCQGCHNRYDAPHRARTRRESRRLALESAGQLLLEGTT